MLAVFLLAILALLLPGAAEAVGAEQDQDSAQESNGGQALRVFLDCERVCDFDYLRRTVRFVNYVRDRQDAQVHVLVSVAMTSASMEYYLEFIGLEDFAGKDDLHRYSSSFTNTDDERRRGFARIFAQGLVHYVIGTPLASRIDIRYDEEESGTRAVAATERDDPWNFWVFRVRGNLNVEAEDRRDRLTVGGSVTANRTTEAWKIAIGVNGDFRQDTFEFDDGDIFESTRRTLGFGAQVVKSVGPHWGIGSGISMAASTFENLDPSYRASAAVEYNLFPYSESSQRELTFTYFAGVTRYNYEEETIFFKTEETLGDQGVLISLDLNRPWGDAGFTIEASHFLHDISKHRLEVRGDIDYRITRGLSINVRGSAGLVRDQLALPAGGASDEEVLLEQQALATDFEYEIRVGLTFTFGSIYNNVVNSRFTGSSGGFHRIIGGGDFGGFGGGGGR